MSAGGWAGRAQRWPVPGLTLGSPYRLLPAAETPGSPAALVGAAAPPPAPTPPRGSPGSAALRRFPPELAVAGGEDFPIPSPTLRQGQSHGGAGAAVPNSPQAPVQPPCAATWSRPGGTALPHHRADPLLRAREARLRMRFGCRVRRSRPPAGAVV